MNRSEDEKSSELCLVSFTFGLPRDWKITSLMELKLEERQGLRDAAHWRQRWIQAAKVTRGNTSNKTTQSRRPSGETYPWAIRVLTSTKGACISFCKTQRSTVGYSNLEFLEPHWIEIN